MTNATLQIKFKQRLNKIASNDYDNIECWQIIEAFNKAQISWCRRQLHGTNQFRGWICGQCNQGMGKLGDDLDGVLMAAKYLAKGNITMIIDKLTGIVRDTSNDPFKGTNMEGKD